MESGAPKNRGATIDRRDCPPQNLLWQFSRIHLWDTFPPVFLGVAAVFYCKAQSPYLFYHSAFKSWINFHISSSLLATSKPSNNNVTVAESIETCTLFVVYKTFEGNYYLEFDASIHTKFIVAILTNTFFMRYILEDNSGHIRTSMANVVTLFLSHETFKYVPPRHLPSNKIA